MAGMPPHALVIRIHGITHRSPRRSEIVLEHADQSGRCRVIAEIRAHRLDGVVVEIHRRPRVELHQVQRLMVSLRLGYGDRWPIRSAMTIDHVIPGLTAFVIPGLTGNLLLGQSVRDSVLMYRPDIDLHRFRRFGLEDGRAFRGDGVEPQGVAVPEIVGSAVAGIGQLPGFSRRRVELVQFFHPVPVADELQNVVFPSQVLHRLRRGFQDTGPFAAVQAPDAETAVIDA